MSGDKPDMAVVVLGVPGTGKSYYIEHRLQELSRQGYYVVAFDPTVSYGRHTEPVWRARSSGELFDNLARDGGGIHCLDWTTSSDFLRVVEAVANEAATCGRATIAAIDEVVGFEGASPNYMPPNFQRLYMWRRHMRLGWFLGSQRPQNMHPMLYDNVPEIVSFRIQNEKALARLAEYGCPAESVAQLSSLRDHHHIVMHPGRAANSGAGERADHEAGVADGTVADDEVSPIVE